MTRYVGILWKVRKDWLYYSTNTNCPKIAYEYDREEGAS